MPSLNLTCKVFTACVALSLLCLACDEPGYEAPDDALFTEIDASDAGVSFINTVTEGEEYNLLSYRNFYNGGGVAVADLNGDGSNDLFFTANQGPNRLYLNRGDWEFEEVTCGAEGTMDWSTGVSVVDVNADGYLDLYVCHSGNPAGDHRSNELFINQGNDEAGTPRFVEMAAAYGLDDQGYSTQSAWFDYDHDGDLDVYLLNNSFLSPQVLNPDGENRNVRDAAGGDKLLRNDPGPDGHPRFTDVSEAAGIYGSRIGFGLGSGIGDFNGDGWTDIYVSNDFWERDYLYLNQQDGTFSEELTDRIDHVSMSSMGSDVGDLDNDGDIDIFTTDMLPTDNLRLKAGTLFDTYNSEFIRFDAKYHHQLLQNCLQANDGSGHFTELAHYAGVAATDWSWGALIFDMDMDGRKDIFVANGIYRDITDMDFVDFIEDKERVRKVVEEKGRYDWRDFVALMPHNEQPNYALLNEGNLHFTNQAVELGLGKPSFSNGAAYGDLDGDGDLELVINNVNQPPLLYRNGARETGGRGVTVSLAGPDANRAGIGARVTLHTSQGRQVLEQYPTRGYLSTVGQELIFGLAAGEEARSVEVRWPDGTVSSTSVPESDDRIRLSHSSAKEGAGAQEPSLAANALLAEVPLPDGPVAHHEPAFNDFDHEGLLLRKLSDPGPKVVRGDVNGDGLEDFVLLGSLDQPDRLFLQTTDGGFAYRTNASLEATAAYESSCGALFDADNDGDLDLMVGNGGNELARGSAAYGLRYYENVNGDLVYNPVKGPDAGGEVSCIVPKDVDLDGDMDVFIGGRAIPGNYGLTPRSYLFTRENGSWVDNTPDDIAEVGMVTDAVWTDLNGDRRPDLVMVGDWMPVTIAFTVNYAEISDIYEIPNSSGWWNTVKAADLDGDGLDDLVLGNWGLNSKFTATPEKPLRMMTNDFDGNGKTEFIIEWYPPAEEQAFPFAPKRQLHAQLPGLRKKTLRYSEYAAATYETLFTEEQRSGATESRAVQLRSCVVWNHGDGKVQVEPLPWQAQLTSQFAVAVGDVNADGRPDLWLGGNQYGLAPQVGRADAGRGTLLLNAGNREWTYVDPQHAGVNLPGQVRDAHFLDMADGGRCLLVARNDAALKLYEVTGNPTR